MEQNENNSSLQNEQPSEQKQPASPYSPINLIFFVLGIIGEVFAINTITTEKRQLFGYSYTSPYTDHEMFIIFIAVVSAILILVGLIKLLQKKM